MKKNKTEFASTMIPGMGRFWGWGNTKEQAKDELIAGLTNLVVQERTAANNLDSRYKRFWEKCAKVVRQGL